MSFVPSILLEGGGESIIVPLKIDITHAGTRIVDSICWNLYSSRLSTEEFIQRTCSDLKLPLAFSYRMQKQLEEQLMAYRDIVSLIKSHVHLIPYWREKATELQSITLGVRHKALDYSDTIVWDPMDTTFTPEQFARSVVEDLIINGTQKSDEELASNKALLNIKPPTKGKSNPELQCYRELQAAIAYSLREALFRRIIHIVEELGLRTENKPETKLTTSSSSADLEKASLLDYHVEEAATVMAKRQFATFKQISTGVAGDMSLSLWKKAKPNSIADVAAVPVPLLPVDKNSNASVWRIQN